MRMPLSRPSRFRTEKSPRVKDVLLKLNKLRVSFATPGAWFRARRDLVAIDDVGFGRSCLENLILLEPDIIKIDKRCVKGISRDKSRARSLKRILGVAAVLNTDVVAEGIENEEDLDVLRTLGVKYGQGYLMDRPDSNA